MLFFRHEERFILDSSSIIDGRVSNLFEKNFLEGRIIIPSLVKSIVEKFGTTDIDRILRVLKRYCPVELIDERSDGMTEEVYILKLAIKKRAKVITTSDELCRQAKSFPYVKVIDLRELHRVLSPILSPQKVISVKMLKKGLKPNEGVGYVEGVKVIVEDGAKFLNQTVNVRILAMISTETRNLVLATMAFKPEEKPAENFITENQEQGVNENGIS